MQMRPRVYLKPVTQTVVDSDAAATEIEKLLRDFDLN